MVFNSLTFLVFFGVILVLHHLPLPWKVKKLNLLVASYLFYAAWNPPFTVLLWMTTAIDFWVARRLATIRDVATRRALLVLSLTGSLGMLGFFKYGLFLLDNFVAALGALGVDFRPAAPDIVLPIGISFYTFHTLSYTLDVYRGRSEPWDSFLDFSLYVTFFPQLVAGPIVRAWFFLPQCRQERRATGAQFAWGLALVVLGLFQKVVVADGIFAPTVDRVFAADAPSGFVAAWCGALAFSGQIFCDFAGYTTCAAGVAMCLGFALPENFRFPYAAVGFSDFWRRWHISLSSWLRDYLYISLGGNQRGRARTYANLLVTMLLGGLWHGASWTFVVWGGLHGLYLTVERLVREAVGKSQVAVPRAAIVAAAAGTYVLVCIAWVFFRATTVGQAVDMVRAMLSLGSSVDGAAPGSAGAALSSGEVVKTLVAVSAMLAIHWRLRDASFEGTVSAMPWGWRAALLGGALVALVTATGEDRAFIYFQF